MIGSAAYAYGWQQVNPKSSCWLMQGKCLCLAQDVEESFALRGGGRRSLLRSSKCDGRHLIHFSHMYNQVMRMGDLYE